MVRGTTSSHSANFFWVRSSAMGSPGDHVARDWSGPPQVRGENPRAGAAARRARAETEMTSGRLLNSSQGRSAAPAVQGVREGPEASLTAFVHMAGCITYTVCPH